MTDLFDSLPSKRSSPPSTGYSAQDIEVLEGLEPVRRRPGMYIGDIGEAGKHHLITELVDNAMDEVVAGHGTQIWVTLDEEGFITVRDNGRGIPADPHPKFPDKSALEVILTTLHSGGKFSGKAYSTSGGLHGVGLSVVNALSETLEIAVARGEDVWVQAYCRGVPQGPLEKKSVARRQRGTRSRFFPDSEIFTEGTDFNPAWIFQLLKTKSYLFHGTTIHWECAPVWLKEGDATPATATLCASEGLATFLADQLVDKTPLLEGGFQGAAVLAGDMGRVEWAINWSEDTEAQLFAFCNAIPTPLGGTHEQGLRQALLKGLRAHADRVGNRKAQAVMIDDVMSRAVVIISLFYKEPHFQGQVKEKLVSIPVTRLVENSMRDPWDHWLAERPDVAEKLLDFLIQIMEERLSRKQDKETARVSATRRLRLPGKLIDCTSTRREETEIFLVEGDSAGGTAKQARNRVTQAVLPLRGKILNVASASQEKMLANQEIKDLGLALGCGFGRHFDLSRLRYQRVIIMTDADVDGAHIAALLMTFFYQQMRPLIEHGHLYIAQPPLYRLTVGKDIFYALDDSVKEKMLKKFEGKKVEMSRFKGLGEMPAHTLKETTIDPKNRCLLKVQINPDAAEEAQIVDHLMGKNPEKRFRFIQDNAVFIRDLDV